MRRSPTLKNPAALAHPDPINLDEYIEALRLALATIPWLQKAFGRAYTISQNDPNGRGGILQVPMVWQGQKEYYPTMANDALKAYSFFRVRGSKDFQDYSFMSPRLTAIAPIDLIVWCDLKAISPQKDYIFTEELQRHVLKVLNNMEEIDVIRIWDDRVEDIFSGYSLKQTQRDLLIYPYQAFRVEFTMNYELFCLDIDPATRTRIFDYTFDETYE